MTAKRGASQAVACPTCGAEAGSPCTIVGRETRRAHYSHAARKRAVDA